MGIRHLGELLAGTIVEVRLSGNPVNVMLMTADGYLNYARRQPYEYEGSRPLRQELFRKEITEENDYYLVTDMENLIGQAETEVKVINQPLLFLSHCSKDKQYADIVRDYIIGLGVRDDQLIYTSHPMHKIPLGNNIFDYLKLKLQKNILVFFLLSDNFFESPACISEMGAVWVNSNDYMLLTVPGFNFNSDKYRGCPIDKDQLAAVLNGDDNFRANMLELKDKIASQLELISDEKKTAHLIQEIVKKITKLEYPK